MSYNCVITEYIFYSSAQTRRVFGTELSLPLLWTDKNYAKHDYDNEAKVAEASLLLMM